jgi:poly-gamma-glutamate synthesis protein (capsule biosynthesis protein)
VVEAGGIRVAFLGYSDVNPLGFPATSTSPGTARAEGIAEDVRRARRRADVVVCWFHWGIELHADPNGQQRALAGAALAAGAQIVLGAHPHVFGRVDRPRPHTLVAWTLGNFVFPAGSGASIRSGILIVRVNARGVAGHRVVAARSGVRPAL